MWRAEDNKDLYIASVNLKNIKTLKDCIDIINEKSIAKEENKLNPLAVTNSNTLIKLKVIMINIIGKTL